MIDELTITLEPHGFTGPVSGTCQHVHTDRTVCGATLVEHPAHRPTKSPTAFAALIVTRDLVDKAPLPRPFESCGPPVTIACPRGCGLLAAARPHLVWGPWRMQAHLMNPRCPAAVPGVTTTRRGRR